MNVNTRWHNPFDLLFAYRVALHTLQERWWPSIAGRGSSKLPLHAATMLGCTEVSPGSKWLDQDIRGWSRMRQAEGGEIRSGCSFPIVPIPRSQNYHKSLNDAQKLSSTTKEVFTTRQQTFDTWCTKQSHCGPMEDWRSCHRSSELPSLHLGRLC